MPDRNVQQNASSECKFRTVCPESHRRLWGKHGGRGERSEQQDRPDVCPVDSRSRSTHLAGPIAIGSRRGFPGIDPKKHSTSLFNAIRPRRWCLWPKK